MKIGPSRLVRGLDVPLTGAAITATSEDANMPLQVQALQDPCPAILAEPHKSKVAALTLAGGCLSTSPL